MQAPVTYIPNFLTEPEGKAALYNLAQLAWLRVGAVPRMEYYINTTGAPYTYGSGEFARTYESRPGDPTISWLWSKAEMQAEVGFEVVFLNRYLNERDHLGWHSDNSPEMDDGRPIAIISIGTPREIWFRRIPPVIKDDGLGLGVSYEPTIDKLMLEHGSLCLMAPGMQDTHQHRIPKSSRACPERISLTFRGYKP